MLRSPLAPLFAAAVVGAIFFAAGFAIATRTAATPQADYVLLLRTSQEQKASEVRVREYVLWAGQAHERGQLVGGEKLAREALLLEGNESMHEAGEIGGFFLIRARGVDEAVRIARDSPHLRYGGTIELRAIEVTAR